MISIGQLTSVALISPIDSKPSLREAFVLLLVARPIHPILVIVTGNLGGESVRTLPILFVVFFCGLMQTQPAFSQDPYLEKALGNVREYFQSVSPVELAKAQAVMSLFGSYDKPIDGRWGPGTEIAFEKNLKTYTAIGGSGPDWGVNAPSDTPRFLTWIEAATHSAMTGSEFPD